MMSSLSVQTVGLCACTSPTCQGESDCSTPRTSCCTSGCMRRLVTAPVILQFALARLHDPPSVAHSITPTKIALAPTLALVTPICCVWRQRGCAAGALRRVTASLQAKHCAELLDAAGPGLDCRHARHPFSLRICPYWPGGRRDVRLPLAHVGFGGPHVQHKQQ